MICQDQIKNIFLTLNTIFDALPNGSSTGVPYGSISHVNSNFITFWSIIGLAIWLHEEIYISVVHRIGRGLHCFPGDDPFSYLNKRTKALSG